MHDLKVVRASALLANGARRKQVTRGVIRAVAAHRSARTEESPRRIALPVQRRLGNGRARKLDAPYLQTKLQISKPNDRFEREADQVANRFVAGERLPKINAMGSVGFATFARQHANNGNTDLEQVAEAAGESRVPNFRAHLPSPVYYQRFAGLQSVRRFQQREGDDERNRLIELYELLASRDPGSYTGNAYEQILPTPSTARSNCIAAAANTPTDPVSNRARWALQVSLLAYSIEYGPPELNTSFVYEWHDFAFRFAGDAPTIGKFPWWILGWADVPGIGEWIGGERGRKLGGDLIGLTIHLLNQPDATIPTWALLFRVTIDALSSFPDAFYGEQIHPVFFSGPVQKKNAERQGNEVGTSGANAKIVGRHFGVGRAVTEAITDLRGGSPLLYNVRTLLESRMGVDLGTVRVHDDATAHALSRALNARAFTHRNHIWLGAGERQSDLWLMAHEVTHIVQQTNPGMAGQTIMRNASLTGNSVILGNPGRFLGLEAHLVAQREGPPRLVHFQVVEAVKGTWLSAVTKALGWDRKFSKAQGYGAYVPGVVFKRDMRPFEIFDPDEIKPGERFLVLLSDQPASGFGDVAVPRKTENLPRVSELLEEPGIELEEGLGAVGEIIDLIGYIDEFVEFSGAAGTAAGALGIFGGILSIFTNMASAGRAGSTTAVTARLRATAYATTAWLFEDRGSELSDAFTSAIASEVMEAEEAWDAEWPKATARLGPWLDKMHATVSRRYREEYRQPPTKTQLLEALRRKADGNATKFCEQLMTSDEITSQLKGEIERLVWDMQVRTTHYPD